MKTRVPPKHRWKLGRRRHNSHSSLSQESRGDDKAKNNVFVYLPREVLFEIFLLLPANLLQEVVRYVCKQWYDIVNDPFFVRAHCQIPTTATTTTTASFIIQDRCKRRKVYCADEDGVITKIRLPFPVMIQGSCNGLVLFRDNCDSDILKVCIMNPLRKLLVSLRRVAPVLSREADNIISYSFAVNSSGQYKVVQLSLYKFPHRLQMMVFTIGVDKAWRRIDVPDHQGILISLNYIDMTQTLNTGGILIAGFLYWGGRNSVSLAMDVDTETLYRISRPPKYLTRKFWNRYNSYFINMGTALGLMGETETDDRKHGIWKVLRLTDVKSSEWTEIGTINICAIISKVSNGKFTCDDSNICLPITPISLIGDELCFCTRNDLGFTWMIRYNLADESFTSYDVKVPYINASCIHHVPTLVSPRKMLHLTSSKLE